MSSYREITPSPRLKRYVECYWYREDERGTPGHRVLPDGCVDLLYSRVKGKPVSLSLVGLMTRPHAHDIPAGQFFFGVRFRAGMASSILRDSALLMDRTVDIRELLSDGKSIFERFAESSSPAEMIAQSERLLRPLEPPDGTEKFLSSLSTTELSLDGLIDQSGFSARHLRREALRRTGVSPKYLSRIIRFRKAAERLQAPPPSWAQFAVACGYYDQAHFIREFQMFAGCTPGRFLQSRS